MDLGIAGKKALVAGASKGLGLAVAQTLAAEGVRVALCARNRDRLSEAASVISAKYTVRAVAIAADLTHPEEPTRIVTQATEALGGLDILVTNAGGPPAGDFFDFEDEDWLKAFRLNCLSALGLIKAAAPAMKQAGWGRIINLTSISVKQPLPPLILSNAVRAGLIGASKTLSQDLGPFGVTINNIATGWTKTGRVEEILAAKSEQTGRAVEDLEAETTAGIPIGRMNRPEEVAAMTVYLASRQAAAITGATIAVDGGFCQGIV